MSDFMKALEKTDPEILTPAKKAEAEDKVTSMSFQDMKDYFEAMKENLMNTMKQNMDELVKQMNTQKQEQPAPEQNEKEGTNDASSSDLQRSE